MIDGNYRPLGLLGANLSEGDILKPPITLFEHDSLLIDSYLLTGRDVDAVNKAAGVEVITAGLPQRGKCRITAAQYVGVVRLRDLEIQILPKIYRTPDPGKGDFNDEEDICRQHKEASRNLLKMLEYAGGLDIKETTLAPMLEQGTSWFEILTRLFSSHLLEEWRRGAVRGYERFDEDLTVLKGQWRINDQLRRPAQNHIFSVSFDEFTADNALNRIFRYVVERLWIVTSDRINRRNLTSLRHMMDEVTLLPRAVSSDAGQALLSRLHDRYQPLLNLARLFLDDGSLQMGSGGLNTYSFVFDMNKLFEAFVVKFIQRNRRDILPEYLQECSLHPQSRGLENFYLAERGGRQVFNLTPDLVIKGPTGQDYPLLIDTKYKLLDSDGLSQGISSDDFYQMFAYAHRYDCPRVLLVYPRNSSMEQRELVDARFRIENSDKHICADWVDLQPDLSKSSGRLEFTADLKRCIAGIYT
jgi:5-methylcytosine-specific restriction enzyme subunit McrC